MSRKLKREEYLIALAVTIVMVGIIYITMFGPP